MENDGFFTMLQYQHTLFHEQRLFFLFFFFRVEWSGLCRNFVWCVCLCATASRQQRGFRTDTAHFFDS